VGLLDALLGRKKLKEAARERLFALSTAAVTLDTQLGLRPAGVAGIVFKPLSAGAFDQAERDLRELLDSVSRDSGSQVERTQDSYGYTWIVVRDPDLEDLVAAIHLVGGELEARGFGPQLLAAVFRFDGGRDPVFFVYGFKRGAFWPFVPRGEGQDRDNARELELKAKLDGELPIEPDLSRWFGLFGAPLEV
jgi:PspAB-like protein